MLRRIHETVRSAFTIVNAINGIARAVTVIRQHTDDKEVLTLVKTIAEAYEKLCQHPVIVAWDKAADDIDNRRREIRYQREESTKQTVGPDDELDLTPVREDSNAKEVSKRLLLATRESRTFDDMVFAQCKHSGLLGSVLPMLDTIIEDWRKTYNVTLLDSDRARMREHARHIATNYFYRDHS